MREDLGRRQVGAVATQLVHPVPWAGRRAGLTASPAPSWLAGLGIEERLALFVSGDDEFLGDRPGLEGGEEGLDVTCSE